MRDDVVAYFENRHKLLESSALTLLLTATEPLALSARLVELTSPESPFVTRQMVEALLVPPSLASISVGPRRASA